MIPTYSPNAIYLKQTLESVLVQDRGNGRMQIEVVDDCSPTVDVAEMVKAIAGERISFSRTPSNLGLAGCWNTCIARARGEWVHILHQDDYISPEFYREAERIAASSPNVSLIAARSFIVNSDNIIESVSQRVPALEHGGNVIDDFISACPTPILCPGVVVRREFYEKHGGFRSDLTFTLDCEMWARAISRGGGVVTSKVLAWYRLSDKNETNRMKRSAESLVDTARLHVLFLREYSGFDAKRLNRILCQSALFQAGHFFRLGDEEAGRANLSFFRNHASFGMKARRLAVQMLKFVEEYL
jgi:glycosyltransferase involved in cell wall biosynthesis